MADTKEESRHAYRGRLEIQPGQPIKIAERAQISDPKPLSPLCKAMGATLKAYMKAGRDLVDGEFAHVRELAPPQLRAPCQVYVLCCPDGVLVRYDSAEGDDDLKVRSADFPESLAKVVPPFSDYLVHAPDDPTTYVPENPGPSLSLQIRREAGTTEMAKFQPLVYVTKTLPSGFPLPAPSGRPPALASVSREMDLHLSGEVLPTNVPPGAISPSPEQFIAHARISFPVGWQAIEIYPRLDPDYWKPEYAASWAKLDLLSAIAQRNALHAALHQLDPRGAARQKYAKLLEEFEDPLSGPEEPCHQFLKSHPELICPTHDAYWSKMAFGAHVSDFIFREPYNDYLLVEIEAPHRLLFRKDGHPRQALTHAVSQIRDWVRYIQDNKLAVEREKGLVLLHRDYDSLAGSG
jgi:hypothetical protein